MKRECRTAVAATHPQRLGGNTSHTEGGGGTANTQRKGRGRKRKRKKQKADK